MLSLKKTAHTIRDTLLFHGWCLRTSLESTLGLRRNGTFLGNKHLALLAWLFPPQVSGGVYRPTSLVRYGTRLGWKISVLTKPINGQVSPAGEYLLRSLPHETPIGRVDLPRLVPSHKLSFRIDGGFLNALATVSLAKRFFLNNPPSVVMASGPPFHNFVAAYYTARLFRAKLVLEYRDEWTECPFDFVSVGNVDRTWEKHCLKYADAVLFTTKSQLIHQVEVFKGLDEMKCRVIPNGWEPADFSLPDKEEIDSNAREGKVVISFLGELGIHSLPGRFLSTLEIVLRRNPKFLKTLRVTFVGNKDRAAKKQLENFSFQEVIESVELVPKPKANAIMRKATALLILYDSRFERYIPGKLYDYLAAGPPLLVVGEKGEAINIVKTLDAGYVVKPDDPDVLEEVLSDLSVGRVRSGDRKRIDEWLAMHTREKMAGRLIEIFEELINEAVAGDHESPYR